MPGRGNHENEKKYNNDEYNDERRSLALLKGCDYYDSDNYDESSDEFYEADEDIESKYSSSNEIRNGQHILTLDRTRNHNLTSSQIFNLILYKLKNDVLEKDNFLVELTINCKNLSEHNLENIFANLGDSRSLLNLTIEGQIISSSAADKLSKALENPACILQSLIIKGCLISIESSNGLDSNDNSNSLKKIVQSLATNRTLHSIKFENNTYAVEQDNNYKILNTDEHKSLNQAILNYFIQALQRNYIITSVLLDIYLEEYLNSLISRNRIFFINAVNCLRGGIILEEDEIYVVYSKITSLYDDDWCENELKFFDDIRVLENLEIIVDILKSKINREGKNLHNTITANDPHWLQSYEKLSRLACNFYNETAPITYKVFPHLINRGRNGLLQKPVYIPGSTYPETEKALKQYIRDHEEKLKTITDPKEARKFDIEASESAKEKFLLFFNANKLAVTKKLSKFSTSEKSSPIEGDSKNKLPQNQETIALTGIGLFTVQVSNESLKHENSKIDEPRLSLTEADTQTSPINKNQLLPPLQILRISLPPTIKNLLAPLAGTNNSNIHLATLPNSSYNPSKPSCSTPSGSKTYGVNLPPITFKNDRNINSNPIFLRK